MVGVHCAPIDMLIRYVETGAFQVLVTHNRYTLLNRTPEPLTDLAAAKGMAVLNAAPYGAWSDDPERNRRKSRA